MTYLYSWPAVQAGSMMIYTRLQTRHCFTGRGTYGLPVHVYLLWNNNTVCHLIQVTAYQRIFMYVEMAQECTSLPKVSLSVLQFIAKVMINIHI